LKLAGLASLSAGLGRARRCQPGVWRMCRSRRRPRCGSA